MFLEDELKIWKKRFIDEKKAQTSSKNTIKTYLRIIDNFIEYSYLERVNSKEELNLKSINRFFLNAYINYLKEEFDLSSKSIELYINVLKSFFMFISQSNEEGLDIYEKIEKVKVKVRDRNIDSYSADEVRKIEKYILQKLDSINSYLKFKNYLNILFLIYTGIRAEESLSITIDDITKEEEFYKIKVLGKGDKERFVYIQTSKIDFFIKKLLMLRDKENIYSKYLFATKKNTKPTYIALYRFNSRVLKTLNIQNRGLHSYRHYVAKEMVKNNINLETIKEWLGHSNILITSKYYAKTNEEAKKESIKKVLV